MDQIHIPVMLDRIVDLLRPGCAPEFSSHPIVVDGTLGLGGHSEAILDNIPNVSVIGLDRDSQAIAKAQKRLEKFGDRFVALHTEYHKVQGALAEADNALCERALAEGINGRSTTWESPQCSWMRTNEVFPTAATPHLTCVWIPPRDKLQLTFLTPIACRN